LREWLEDRLRKEIKIRPGFTPQEDVTKFRSARQSDFESKKLPKGSVVGLIRPEVAVAQSALKGMSQAQKKNAKRKEKRKAENSKAETEETPEQWDDDRSSTGSNPPDKSEAQARATPHPASRPPQGKANPGKTLFQSALKSSSANPQTPASQHLVPPQTAPASKKDPPSGSTPALKKENHAFKLFTNAVQSLELDDKSKPHPQS
jgi:partner of Y14 and mago protein